MKQKLSGLSVVFPAFNDEKSIPILIKKILPLLRHVANDYEIIIVNDGSKDKTGQVLKNLQRRIPFLKIVTHKINQGYGAALASGFNKAQKDFIFYTDGDGQYDVKELKKLLANFDKETDIVTGFKLWRDDFWYRKIIGHFYNQFVKIVFGLKVKDVDCDFRLFRREIIKGLKFRTTSGAFDLEFIKKMQEKNVNFKEIGVSHYPRIYGKSQFFQVERIGKSLWEMFLILFKK